MKHSEKMGTLWECGPRILSEYTPATQDSFSGLPLAPLGIREKYFMIRFGVFILLVFVGTELSAFSHFQQAIDLSVDGPAGTNNRKNTDAFKKSLEDCQKLMNDSQAELQTLTQARKELLEELQKLEKEEAEKFMAELEAMEEEWLKKLEEEKESLLKSKDPLEEQWKQWEKLSEATETVQKEKIEKLNREIEEKLLVPSIKRALGKIDSLLDKGDSESLKDAQTLKEKLDKVYSKGLSSKAKEELKAGVDKRSLGISRAQTGYTLLGSGGAQAGKYINDTLHSIWGQDSRPQSPQVPPPSETSSLRAENAEQYRQQLNEWRAQQNAGDKKVFDEKMKPLLEKLNNSSDPRLSDISSEIWHDKLPDGSKMGASEPSKSSTPSESSTSPAATPSTSPSTNSASTSQTPNPANTISQTPSSSATTPTNGGTANSGVSSKIDSPRGTLAEKAMSGGREHGTGRMERRAEGENESKNSSNPSTAAPMGSSSANTLPRTGVAAGTAAPVKSGVGPNGNEPRSRTNSDSAPKNDTLVEQQNKGPWRAGDPVPKTTTSRKENLYVVGEGFRSGGTSSTPSNSGTEAPNSTGAPASAAPTSTTIASESSSSELSSSLSYSSDRSDRKISTKSGGTIELLKVNDLKLSGTVVAEPTISSSSNSVAIAKEVATNPDKNLGGPKAVGQSVSLLGNADEEMVALAAAGAKRALQPQSPSKPSAIETFALRNLESAQGLTPREVSSQSTDVSPLEPRVRGLFAAKTKPAPKKAGVAAPAPKRSIASVTPKASTGFLVRGFRETRRLLGAR